MKDKAFELELSWVGEGKDSSWRDTPFVCLNLVTSFLVTGGLHQMVPKDIQEEAEQYAKVCRIVY